MNAASISKFGLTLAASLLFVANAGNALAHNEFVVHHGMAGASVDIVDAFFYGASEKVELQNGVIDEDTGVRSLGHFYNPKLDSAPGFSLGNGASPDNAIDRWNSAQSAFNASNYHGVDAAFHMLGRSIHLMQDATSPPHTHDDAHVPPDGSDFEDWGPGAWPSFSFASVMPEFPAVRTPDGYVKNAANFTYDMTSYQVEIDEQAGAQISSEYQQMFPSLVFIDGGIFGDDRWEVDKVGCYGCVLGDDWWLDDFGAVSNNSGRGGSAYEAGTAYIESTGGGTGDGDPRPQVWNGIDNSVDQKSLLQLYGEGMYPKAVALGAGMLIDFMTDQLENSCGNVVVDFGEQCDDGNTIAGDCCSPTCTFETSATVCRTSAGECDAAETCTGSSGICPNNSFVSNATVCRDAASDCDAAENCTGAGADCPTDLIASAATVCRASTGECDEEDFCDGVTTACTADALADAGTECRAAAGQCDEAETCTGSDADCPADAFVSSATACRGSAGTCDIVENCTGSAADCPTDSFEPGSTQCRAADGACDVAEVCSGTGAFCPSDGFAADTTVCRIAADLCDTEEACSGSTGACPNDLLASVGTVCRTTAGSCDAAETCSGSEVTCPTDEFLAAETECRAVAGLCDIAEQCTGSGADCPSDGLVSAATPCRVAVGECDVEEVCAGDDVACPMDEVVETGTACTEDSLACTEDTCDGAGTCTHVHMASLCTTTTTTSTTSTTTTSTSTTSTTSTTTTTLPPSFVQTKNQQKCILILNKNVRKVAQAQARETSLCVKAAAREPVDLEACVIADTKQRLARAFAKTIKHHSKKCSEGPDFGYATAQTINDASSSEALALAHDFFGEPIDVAVNGLDESTIDCQARAIAAAERLVDAKLKAFGKCKKIGLKIAGIRNFVELAECLDATLPTASNKLAKAELIFKEKVSDDCVLIDASIAFPATCAGETGALSLANCLTAAADCRVCRMLNAADGMIANCDLFDDGLKNSSCPQ